VVRAGASLSALGRGASLHPGVEGRLERRTSGFLTLDELVRSTSSRGLVVVSGSRDALAALARHTLRRVRALGRPAVAVRVDALDGYHELVAQLGVREVIDPVAGARAIAREISGAVVIVARTREARWGQALEAELGRGLATESGALVLSCVVDGDAGGGDAREARADARGETRDGREPEEAARFRADGEPHGEVRLERSLGLEARVAFWEAAAASFSRGPSEKLTELDHHLRGMEQVPRTAPLEAAHRSPLEADVLARLGAAGIALPLAALAAGGPDEASPDDVMAAVEALHARGLVEIDVRGRVSPSPSLEELPPLGDEGVRAIAETLGALDEPWSLLRAAELFAALGEGEAAETAGMRAIAGLVDGDARADFWRRLERALGQHAQRPQHDASVRQGGSASSMVRLAEFAIRVGDVDRAVTLARGAVAKAADDPRALLVLGRATAARGDLPGAAAVLAKAHARAGGDAERARASVELAELAYLSGDLEAAARHACEGLSTPAVDARTRLDARNVLGKLLLARASWDDADRHFADDACEATLSGDIEAELRARLNRAIALLSSGRRDEARAMLEAVRDDGEERSELRAVSFALANLATLAILQHAYAEALRLSEHAIDVRRRIGERVGLARLITNLAALRLRLGLVAEAEQALLFGRQACGPGMPGIRASHFSLVTARVLLERGAADEARGEAERALAAATSASDGAKAGECRRLIARICLDDGDLVRMRRALDTAREASASPDAAAELALLEALYARASGNPSVDLARAALEQATLADDEELVAEAHVLLHRLLGGASSQVGFDQAMEHLEAACARRDRVLAGLPPELRARFLGRRDMLELEQLERVAREAEARRSVVHDEAPKTLPSGARPRSSSAVTTQALAEARGDERLERGAATAAGSRTLVGRHPAMLALVGQIQRLASTDATVLIRGESGTGKELVAEALHAASPRRSGPLVKVNCSALVETLLLSELFGHERGAFTGATARRRGRFELAEGGTLFLDEIGDISPRTQVALLRVLQEKSFERVGGTSSLRADVRVVCATHRDLRAMVQQGTFREDLYYRLRQVQLDVPSLRQRASDLALLADDVLLRVSRELSTPLRRLSDEALRGLAEYSWPGNVRELENALRAAALFSEGVVLELRDVREHLEGFHAACDELEPSDPSRAGALERGSCPNTLAGAGSPGDDRSPTEVAYSAIRAGVSLHDMKRQIERECVARALAETAGNITKAAVLLGMKRPRLSQLVKQYGMSADSED
jgi:DNA-binding NtrC family response regulator/tetratricopeptide (TPR) repeat protein